MPDAGTEGRGLRFPRAGVRIVFDRSAGPLREGVDRRALKAGEQVVPQPKSYAFQTEQIPQILTGDPVLGLMGMEGRADGSRSSRRRR